MPRDINLRDKRHLTIIITTLHVSDLLSPFQELEMFKEKRSHRLEFMFAPSILKIRLFIIMPFQFA